MGIIQRQGLKSSIISYIGVAIGAISTIFVYPHALEIIGLFRALFDTSVLVGIVVLLGSSSSAVRFFPRYQDSTSGHNGLLTWLFIVSGAGFLIFLLLFPFLYSWIKGLLFDDANHIYEDFVIFLVPLSFLLVVINLLSRYISNFKRIAIPAALEQLSIKIALPFLMLMYIAGWIDAKGVMIGVVITFLFSALGMVLYLRYLGEWRFTRPVILKDKPGLIEFSKYSWYGLLTGIGSQVAFRIDTLMITNMVQMQATGIYTISWALSEIISKPMRSLGAIAGPLLAQKIEENKMDEVQTIYRKSSLNMTIIGLGLFLLIWSVLPYILNIMPNSEIMQQGKYVVFFLGLAQVWDMMTGVNSEIISYSKHYRFVLYLTLFLAVTNILANLIFIQIYGIAGAALATCISMMLYNLVKLVFIKVKFGFQPFGSRLIPAITFCIAAWLITTLLPETGSNLLNIIYKGSIFSLLYGFSIWKFNISPDINHWIDLGRNKLMTFFSRE